jgi:hypothetical protein
MSAETEPTYPVADQYDAPESVRWSRQVKAFTLRTLRELFRTVLSPHGFESTFQCSSEDGIGRGECRCIGQYERMSASTVRRAAERYIRSGCHSSRQTSR